MMSDFIAQQFMVILFELKLFIALQNFIVFSRKIRLVWEAANRVDSMYLLNHSKRSSDFKLQMKISKMKFIMSFLLYKIRNYLNYCTLYVFLYRIF